MIPAMIELINGDILYTIDGETYMVLVDAPPFVQVSIRMKIDGTFRIGLLWYRINEKWMKVKNLYIKANGSWLLSKNALEQEG